MALAPSEFLQRSNRVFKFVTGVLNKAFDESQVASLAEDIELLLGKPPKRLHFEVACNALAVAISAGHVPQRGKDVLAILLKEDQSHFKLRRALDLGSPVKSPCPQVSSSVRIYSVRLRGRQLPKLKSRNLPTESEPTLDVKPLRCGGVDGPLHVTVPGWQRVIADSHRRTFVSACSNVFSPALLDKWFHQLRDELPWIQPRVGKDSTLLPRKVAWLVRPGCCCDYAYGSVVSPAEKFQPWFEDLTDAVCGAAGIVERPTSCNANLYLGPEHSVNWHADDEGIFRATDQDTLILSLSLSPGHARRFELVSRDELAGPEPTATSMLLGHGDLCSMEGMCQRYYLHRAPRAETPSKKVTGVDSVRINLTWRWVRRHCGRQVGDVHEACPHSRKPPPVQLVSALTSSEKEAKKLVKRLREILVLESKLERTDVLKTNQLDKISTKGEDINRLFNVMKHVEPTSDVLVQIKAALVDCGCSGTLPPNVLESSLLLDVSDREAPTKVPTTLADYERDNVVCISYDESDRKDYCTNPRNSSDANKLEVVPCVEQDVLASLEVPKSRGSRGGLSGSRRKFQARRKKLEDA